MKNKGITLIALIITIIVLIILAGVSINLLLGDNGLIKRAQDTKLISQAASIQERIDLWKAEYEMAQYTGIEATELTVFLQQLVTEGLLTNEQANEVLASENKELVIGNKTLSFLLGEPEGENPDEDGTTAVQGVGIESLTYTRSGNSLNLNTEAYELIPLEEEYIGELTKAEGMTYGFVAGEDGTIVSENVENATLPEDETEMPTFADSYIKIDLTSVEEDVQVKIKATASSLVGGIIAKTDSTKSVMEVMGETNAEISGTLTEEATINIEAGTVQYIHFVYIYAGKDTENGIEDKLTINSININKKAKNTELTYKYIINDEARESTNVATDAIVLDLAGQEAVEGVSPKIPQGFCHLEGTIGEGYVISDLDKNYTVEVEVKNSSGEIATETIEIKGNEFVWIPVELEEGETFESKYPRTTFEGNIATGNASIYTEPYEEGYEGEDVEYEEMIASVNSNKGFYVGRYETGFLGETAKTGYTSYSSDPTQEEIEREAAKLVVQKDAQIYTYVPWGSEMNDITAVNKGTEDTPAYLIGAVQLAQNFDTVNNYSGVTSTLIYGIQWDMVMRYVTDGGYNVNDSSSWGNYKDYSSTTGDTSTESGNIQTTGKNEAWQAKNIYDLAGNVEEWTMETGAFLENDLRVFRGGRWNQNGTETAASDRAGTNPYYDGGDWRGFRIALYL